METNKVVRDSFKVRAAAWVLAAAMLVFGSVGEAGLAIVDPVTGEIVLDLDEVAEVADPRIALVIGNGAYAHLGIIDSGDIDAEGVGAAFERLGFTVTTLTDAGYVDMLWGLQKFAKAAREAEAAVVFYAGNGSAVDGRNFLVPVDARRMDPDAFNHHVTEGNSGWIPVTWLMRSVEGASRLRLVILDTAVHAPLKLEGEVFVAQASKADEWPSSGHFDPAGYSPFTEALLRYLEVPGLELRMLFRKVRADVMRATEGHQNPVVHGSLPAWEVYLASSPGQPPTSESDPPSPTEEAPAQ